MKTVMTQPKSRKQIEAELNQLVADGELFAADFDSKTRSFRTVATGASEPVTHWQELVLLEDGSDEETWPTLESIGVALEVGGESPRVATISPIEIEMSLLRDDNGVGAALDKYIEAAVEASTREEVKAAEKSYIDFCIDNREPGVSFEAAEFDAGVDLGYVARIIRKRRGDDLV